MNIDVEQVKRLLENSAAQAESILNDPSKVDGILMDAEEKLKEVPAVGNTLSELPLMAAMVKGYITKEYTQVSPKVIALMLGAFIYFVKKNDLISDKVPVLGVVDDVAVLGLALKLSEKELNDFSAWRKEKYEGNSML